MEKTEQQLELRFIEDKTCSTCKINKPLTEFPIRGKGIYHGYCKRCMAISSRESQIRKQQGLPSLRNRPKQDSLTGETTKQCFRCKVVKPLSAFTKNKRYCLECKRTIATSYRVKVAANPELRQKQYKWHKRYVAKNSERLNAEARKWRKAHPDIIRENGRKRRARERGATYAERINRQAIIERDNSTCYLCQKILQPNEITLDHVIPLVRGGHHAAYNLKVACFSCNCKKKAKPLEEYLNSLRA